MSQYRDGDGMSWVKGQLLAFIWKFGSEQIKRKNDDDQKSRVKMEAHFIFVCMEL